jgi:hypothetical protein
MKKNKLGLLGILMIVLSAPSVFAQTQNPQNTFPYDGFCESGAVLTAQNVGKYFSAGGTQATLAASMLLGHRNRQCNAITGCTAWSDVSYMASTGGTDGLMDESIFSLSLEIVNNDVNVSIGFAVEYLAPKNQTMYDSPTQSLDLNSFSAGLPVSITTQSGMGNGKVYLHQDCFKYRGTAGIIGANGEYIETSQAVAIAGF